MTTSAEMPRYQCHKIVHALKIKEVTYNDTNGSTGLLFEDAGYAPIEAKPAFVDKHNPQPGGYYVVYEDGYTSFSPAAAFESGYTRLTRESAATPKITHAPHVLALSHFDAKSGAVPVWGLEAPTPLDIHADGLTPEAVLHVEISGQCRTAIPDGEGNARLSFKPLTFEPGLHFYVAAVMGRDDDGRLTLLAGPEAGCFRTTSAHLAAAGK